MIAVKLLSQVSMNIIALVRFKLQYVLLTLANSNNLCRFKHRNAFLLKQVYLEVILNIINDLYF